MDDKNSLEKNAVGFWSLLGQSVALIAPLGAVAATLTGSAAFALGSLPLAYLLAIFGVLTWINVPYQFSKKITNAGGFYTFALGGIGPRYGLVTGLLYLFSYFNVITNAILFTGGVFIPSILSEFLGITLPSWFWIIFLIVFLTSFTVLAYLGIRPSLKYSFAASLIEIVLLIWLSITIILKVGPHNTLVPFTPIAPGGWVAVFEGMILAIFSMSGSSGAVYIAEEVKQPRKNVRLAVLISFLITGVVFVLVSYAFTVGWGIDNMATFASSGIPGLILADKYIGLPATIILFIFIVNSLFAGSLAPLNSAARLLYALGRDGVLPSFFGEVHPKYKSPANSILFLAILSAIVSIAAGLIMGPYYGFLYLILASSIALFIGHILGDIALPFFYNRIRNFNIVLHGITPAISFIILVIGIYYSFYPPTYPINIAAITTSAFAILVIIYALINKNIQKLRNLNFEEPDDKV
ncbi:MAG: APC family permease [Sulfolobaceae archaeon]|nr:APC family permease [Sulfolobaceae archaeon]